MPPQGAYPGTCRNLSNAEREAKRAVRPAAIRLRADVAEATVRDVLHGSYTGVVDDFVLRRNDGVTAYNLAVVVDDAAQGIDQVVRGDDLLPSTPRQAYLASLLNMPVPEYAHVPLVLNADGARLAKRDGAVTLADLALAGVSADAGPGRAAGVPRASRRAISSDALAVFDPARTCPGSPGCGPGSGGPRERRRANGQPRRVGWNHDRAVTPPATLHRRDGQGPGRGGPQPPEGQAQAALPGTCARRRGCPGGLRRRHPDRRVPPRHRRGHPDDASGAAGHGRLRAGRGHYRAGHEAPAREPGRLSGRHPVHRRGP